MYVCMYCMLCMYVCMYACKNIIAITAKFLTKTEQTFDAEKLPFMQKERGGENSIYAELQKTK